MQSHFVLRRPDAVWLDGKALTMPKGTAERPGEVRIPGRLVLRYGSAVVGVCVPWFQAWGPDCDGPRLVDDGNAWNCLRLTIDHGFRSDLEKTPRTGKSPGPQFGSAWGAT